MIPAVSPHRVVVLVIEGVLPLDLGIPLQVFGRGFGSPYALTVCGEVAGPVPLAWGADVVVAVGLEALTSADTVIVPGYLPIDRPLSPAIASALADAHSRGARLVSICYGAFALAAAGLLQGRRATTHWDATGELARRFPAVLVDPNVLFVDEGDVLTSAGVAAGLDLCLYLVRKDLGAKAANDLARRLVTSPRRPGGQAQYIPMPNPPAADDRLEAVRDWAREHLHEPLTLSDLAARAKMSPRTLQRRFAEETGKSPHRWLLEARIARARALLEDTDLAVDRIAERTGLGTGANLRLHFRRALQVSPSEYRKAFASALQR